MDVKINELKYEFEFLNDIFEKNINLDNKIEQVFNYIISMSDIDSVFLNVFNSELTKLKRTHEVTRKGSTPYIDIFKKTSVDINNMIMDHFYKNGLFIYNNLDKTTTDPHLNKRLSELHIKSLLLYPIKINNTIMGSIGITYNRRKSSFTMVHIKLLKFISEKISYTFEYQYNEIKGNINTTLYEHVFNNLFYPLVVINERYEIIDANALFEQIFDLPIYEILHKNFFKIFDSNENKKIYKCITNTKQYSTDNYVEIFKMIKGDKKIFRLTPFKINDKQSSYYAVLFNDVTLYKVEERKLNKLAYFDVDTGLKNKNYYEEACIELDKKLDLKSLGIISMRINHLYHINKEHGYEKGNQLVIDFSNILMGLFHMEYLNARIRGEEFLVLSLNQPERHFISIIKELNKKIDHYNDSHQIKLSLSIGTKYLDNIEEPIKNLINQVKGSQLKYPIE